MRMGALLISLVLIGAVFLSGCTDQTGVEVEGDELYTTQSSIVISRLDVVHGHEWERVFQDTVVTLLVYAANVGPEVAFQEFYFSINGIVKQMKNVSFIPGEEHIVTFSTECTDCSESQSYLTDIGTYRLVVNDFETTVEVVESPVLLTIESIEWHAIGTDDDLRYIPYIIIHILNTGEGEYPLTYWELTVDDEIVDNIVRTQMSTITNLIAYSEGRVILKPNGVHALDENGLDIKLSKLVLRDQPAEGYNGGILGSVNI